VLGAVLALLSAVSFGLNNAAVRRGVLTGSVLQALAITVTMGVPLFAVIGLAVGAQHALASFGAASWAWLALAGAVHFVGGRYGNYKATQAVGAALSGPIQQLSVPLALVLAMVFLGEKLTPLRLIGIVLVMLAPMIILRGRRSERPGRPQASFKPNYLAGALWGLVGAAGYGTSPLLIHLGLEGRGIVDSIAGGFISYAAATVIILALLLVPANRARVLSTDRVTARWFAFSGVAVFVSQLFRYMALSIAPVSVVTTIQRTSVAFRAVFGWALNRDHEILDMRTIAGVGLSMLGALALTVSTDFVLAHVALPDAVAAAARATWP
jgi:drug/metabolite transporter (DMT)-like permease